MVVYAGNPFYLAFSLLLFYCALLFEKINDAPRLNCLKLYLITVLAKSEETTLSGYNSALGNRVVNLGYLKDSQYSATDLPVQIESNDQHSWWRLRNRRHLVQRLDLLRSYLHQWSYRLPLVVLVFGLVPKRLRLGALRLW